MEGQDMLKNLQKIKKYEEESLFSLRQLFLQNHWLHKRCCRNYASKC